MTALVIALCYIFTVGGLMRAGVVPGDFVPVYSLATILLIGIGAAILEGVRTINSETPRPCTGGEHEQTTKEP